MKVKSMRTKLQYSDKIAADPEGKSSVKCRRFVDSDYDLYKEGCFKEILSDERKRTERSGKPFLLIVLNIENILQVVNSREVLKDMMTVLSSSARETDLCGWYRDNAEIGIIFTEIDENNTGKALESIRGKMRERLLEALPLAMIEKVELKLHFYPEKYNQGTKVKLIDESLYPDMANPGHLPVLPRFLKRCIDLFGVFLAMIIFSPFFLIIPVLIRLTSKGPVFFRQERIGQLGNKFVFLKFRSMYVDCDDSIHREYTAKLIAGKINRDQGQAGGNGHGVYKLLDDPRVTPLGRFLRKTSLDEIPQFLNVLKGEMSLVGPRPPIPYEFEKYDIWHRHRILRVKPGITGLWQVKGRSSTSFDEMVRLDLKYIREWSPWLDIKLLLQTPWAVLKGKGAY